MDRTENDLSFNKAELDYQAMLTTATVAYRGCLREIERHLQVMRSLHKKVYLPYLSAQWLESEAKYLTIVAETMHTLQEGLSREELVIVNKPEVKEV